MLSINKYIEEQSISDLFVLKEIPLTLKDNKENTKNHLSTIKNYALGPSDPLKSNKDYWQKKAKLWGITEGDARSRLCLNCEHYVSTKQIQDWINSGPAKNFKASDLPVTPKLIDIESKPEAYCVLMKITCSPVRTCDKQEPGGPLDDVKIQSLILSKTVEDNLDIDELIELIKSHNKGK